MLLLWSINIEKKKRLLNGSLGANAAEVEQFFRWILQVGESKLFEPNEVHVEIEFFRELIPKIDKPISAIVQSTYPDLLQNFMYVKFLETRAILASTIETVND